MTVVRARSRTRAVRQLAAASLPTRSGDFRIAAFHVDGAAGQIVALERPIPRGAVPLVRLHSECFTGDVLGSLRCDCGDQLAIALARVASEGGILLYLPQEGRGIGLVNKLRAYRLQESGLDTVDANLALGLPADARDYTGAAAVLRHRGMRRVRLLTNNPAKHASLERHGIHVVERVPLETPANATNVAYLRTKAIRMGHLLAALEAAEGTAS